MILRLRSISVQVVTSWGDALEYNGIVATNRDNDVRDYIDIALYVGGCSATGSTKHEQKSPRTRSIEQINRKTTKAPQNGAFLSLLTTKTLKRLKRLYGEKCVLICVLLIAPTF